MLSSVDKLALLILLLLLLLNDTEELVAFGLSLLGEHDLVLNKLLLAGKIKIGCVLFR